MNDKEEKFWTVAIKNGVLDHLREENGDVKEFKDRKLAEIAAKEKALELGPKYLVTIMEPVFGEVGEMVTRRVYFQTSEPVRE